jgi:hypothetical protein
MNDLKDLRRALFRTGDGFSVLLWLLIYAVLFVRSIKYDGIAPHQFKYLFLSLITLLIFARFRVSSFQNELRTNIWGFLNVNAFGLIILLMELIYE